MIHVAEFNGGQVRLEISNQAEFIRQFKQARREMKKKPGTWKIRVIGTDRVTAPIQKLIDECSGQKTEPEIPSTPPSANGHALELHEPKAEAAHREFREQQKPVRQRPGGPLTSD